MQLDDNTCYAEVLIKISSPAPDFKTHYEWLILQVDTADEEIAKQKATEYMKLSYDRSYQGGVLIELSFLKLVNVSRGLGIVEKGVQEGYSILFSDIEGFDKWRNSFEAE